jgi:Recombinase
MNDAEVRALATLKGFLVDSEIPVRELAELAFANWIAARSVCADERERSEWALLADLILRRARKIVESWTAASERADAHYEAAADSGGRSPFRPLPEVLKDQRAANVIPIMRQIQRSGATSLRQIAEALNARGINAPRGGQWHATSVRNVMARA